MPKNAEDLYLESERIRRDVADLTGRVQQLTAGLADLAHPEPLEDDCAILDKAREIAVANQDFPAAAAIRDLLAELRSSKVLAEMAKPKVRVEG